MSCSFILAVVLALPSGVPGEDKTDASTLKLSEDEQTILDLTNAERAKEKLQPLTANPLLFRAARAHSADMAKKGEMKHVLDGKDVLAAARRGEYDFRKCGENIAMSDGAPLKEVMKGWMESKGHREHILDPAFTEIGIGTARTTRAKSITPRTLACRSGSREGRPAYGQ